MIAVVQRVLSASVEAGGKIVGSIGHGMLALVAAESGDGCTQVEWMANRLIGLRMFEDSAGKMNFSADEVGGSFLVVSNFTVAGDTQGGRRPSFTRAASFDEGRALFDLLLTSMRKSQPDVQTGVYGEEMKVTLENDGPITLIVETPRG